MPTVESYESSIVGTAVQFTGTVLVALLCAILLRTFRRRFLAYWAAAWASLSLALAALLCAFALPRFAPLALPCYCFFEYVCGYLWLAGCRNLHGDFALGRRDWVLVAPAAGVALALPWVTRDINGLMAIHALVMACLFAASFAALFVGRHVSRGAGIGVMMAALFVLTVEFLHYAPLCGYCYLSGHEHNFPHLRYSSLYDLMLEMLLAFGMVMVVMELVHDELETANRELRTTGNRLRRLAECDALTGTLNRRAFDSLMAETPFGDALTGCVAVLDIDNLKPINDTLGHAAGDRTIRLVADTLRSVIRPDDLLFRWGGDEFLILWLGPVRESDAAHRLDRLNEELTRNAKLGDVPYPAAPTVSYGLALFAAREELPEAIQAADESMYARKQSRPGRERLASTAAR